MSQNSQKLESPVLEKQKRLRPLLPRPPAGTTILQSAGISGGTLQLIAVTRSDEEGVWEPAKSEPAEVTSQKSLLALDERLRVLLPVGYIYKLMEFKSDESGNSNNFTAVLRINISSADTARRWLKEFSNVSLCDFTIVRSTKCVGHFKRFGQIMKCHRNVQRGKLGRGKHCACPARLVMSVRALPQKPRVKSKDQAFPAQVVLVWRHNHPVLGEGMVMGGDRGSVVMRDRVIDLYQRGHTPGTARVVLDIEEVFGRDILNLLNDSTHCNTTESLGTVPDLSTLYYYYYRHYKKLEETSLSSDERMSRLVEQTCERLDDKTSVRIVTTESGRTTVAICTPFMKRVHVMIPDAGLRVYVDGSQTFGSDGYKVYLFMCLSGCGAVPLGAVILNPDTTASVTEGFRILASALPGKEKSFFGRGSSGPYCFITDDSTAEVVALSEVWPRSQICIGESHILQSLWRWLKDPSHCIEAADSPALLHTVKQWLLVSSEQELLLLMQQLSQDKTAQKYPHFVSHVMSVAERRALWVSLYRHVFDGGSKSFITAAEAGMRVVRERMFERCRGFDVIQMTDFIASVFSRFYCARLVEASRNLLCSLLRVTHVEPRGDEEIVKTSCDTYTVSGRTVFSTQDVDTLSCTCTCKGAMCKHLVWVVGAEEVDSFSQTQRHRTVRNVWYELATGCQAPEGWIISSSTSGEAEQDQPVIVYAMPAVSERDEMNDEHSAETQNVTLVSKQIEEIQQTLHKTFNTCIQDNPQQILEPLQRFRDSLAGLRTQMSIIRALRVFSKTVDNSRAKARKVRSGEDKTSNVVKRKRKLLIRGEMIGASSANEQSAYISHPIDTVYTSTSEAIGSTLKSSGFITHSVLTPLSSASAFLMPAAVSSSLSSYLMPTVISTSHPSSFPLPTLPSSTLGVAVPGGSYLMPAGDRDALGRETTSNHLTNFDGLFHSYLPLL